LSFLTYSLVSAASFSGLFAGAALAFIAPEEMDIGRKHFSMLRKIFFSILILSFGFFYSRQSIMAALLFVVLGSLFIFLANKKFIYPILGALFYSSNIDIVLFEITAISIFLMGLPMGTLFAEEHKKMKKMMILKKLFLQNAMFFVICLPLYFLKF